MPDTTTQMQSVPPAPLSVAKWSDSKSWSLVVTLVSLIAILGFAFWLRLPMIVHAERHLDSDLAVDGLVLRDYLRNGKLQAAYPGTPHIATIPVFLSLPAVRVWGDSPATLVFAGTAAALLMIVPVFMLARKAYGIVPAILAGVVLAAGGLGQVWLSARVSGGHMLAAAWLAWVWWFWTCLIGRRSVLIWCVFGVICSIAFYSDRIFMIGLAAVGLATLAAIRPYRETVSGSIRTKQAAVFLISLAGNSFIFNDLAVSGNPTAYGDQFAISTETQAIVEHLRLLFLECLPRLIIGRILPDGSTGVTFTHPGKILPEAIEGRSPIVWIMAGIFVIASAIRSITKSVRNATENRTFLHELLWLGPMRFGLSATTMLTFLAFMLNRNIFNSDNYRYLVLLLPGIGMAVARIAAAGPRQSLRRGLLIAFAAFLAFDTLNWQMQVGFRSGLISIPVADNDIQADSADLVDILKSNPPVVTGGFESDYWEVYRALYLANLPVDQGQPFGFFPNRFFPAGTNSRPVKPPRFVVITKSPTSMQILAQIRAEGARRVFTSPSLEIYERIAAPSAPDQPAKIPSEMP